MTRNSINDRKICKVLVFGAGVIGRMYWLRRGMT